MKNGILRCPGLRCMGLGFPLSKVLPYKWEAYRRTNGRRIAVQMWEVYCWVSLSSRLRSQEGPAIQMGAYCRTNWRCTAVLSSSPVGVGVSETLLKNVFWKSKVTISLFSTPRWPFYPLQRPPPKWTVSNCDLQVTTNWEIPVKQTKPPKG